MVWQERYKTEGGGWVRKEVPVELFPKQAWRKKSFFFFFKVPLFNAMVDSEHVKQE